MTIEIKKWGNSLGLRIPRDIARNLGLEEGSEVSLEVEDGKLSVVPRQSLNIESAEGEFRAHKREPIKGKPGNGKTVVQIIREMRDARW